MAAPSKDFLNDAVDAVVTALKASPDFMSASAAGAPVGAAGTVLLVEDYLPETEEIPDHYLPHAGVVWLGWEILEEESSAGETEMAIDIGIRLYGRSLDRRAMWRDLGKAAAAIERVVALEMNADGGEFGGFASNAKTLGGDAIDVKERLGSGGLALVRIQLWVTRTDY